MSNSQSEQQIQAKHLISCLDLTCLADDANAAMQIELCRQACAARPMVAAVCVWPQFVSLVREQLQLQLRKIKSNTASKNIPENEPETKQDASTKIAIATVVNFPSGMQPLVQTLGQIRQVLIDGADEIDLVMPYPLLMPACSDQFTTAELSLGVFEATCNHDNTIKGVAPSETTPAPSTEISSLARVYAYLRACVLYSRNQAHALQRPAAKIKIIIESGELELVKSPWVTNSVIHLVHDAELITQLLPHVSSLLTQHEFVAPMTQNGTITKDVSVQTGASLVALASRLAILAGADFIKTSTGKTAHGASLSAVGCMARTIAKANNKVECTINNATINYARTGAAGNTAAIAAVCGIKISGGVKTFQQAQDYYQAVCSTLTVKDLAADYFRVGASSLLQQLARV